MSESVTLPALGESVTEGTVTRWLKQVGDSVEVDEPLLEVSTDKVDTEIPSPVAGVIEEILVQEDETVEVGAELVRIGDGSGSASSESAPQPEEAESAPVEQEPEPAQPAPAQSAPAPQPAPHQLPEEDASAGASYTTPQPEDEVAPSAGGSQPPLAQEATSSVDAEPGQDASRDASSPSTPPTPAAPAPAPAAAAPAPAPAAPAPAPAQPAAPADQAGGAHAAAPYVTPIVRKLAHDRGVDLSSVQGSGVGGRIRKEDVLAAAEAKAPAAAESAPAAAAAPAEPVEPSPLRGTTVKMSRLRKVVAERAVVSMQSTAQLTTVVEVDVTAVAKLRAAVKDEFLAKSGQKLSFLPFFALAAVEALQQYPIINATVDGDSIVYPDTENVSIAVDTERGLLTPVIRNAGGRSIADLAGQIADLASRTRDNKLKPDELAGGTFTLTNTGSRGALFDTPLVFLPQVAILGTGAVVKKPAIVTTADGSESIAIRSTVYLALSYDHRIVDGADAARFLTAVKQRLEGGDFRGSLGI
ncbi:2-oxoglutarate dehydrogenase, E2 component, dihydrolipoamide succinyltransferase [Amnibacterium soli]|uniref:Dihydrolipoamide acetyltransferase component of pyruvate dehydrogenase complex n=1 Tax=Amnibacterium soli TaxID=1282736 RepID=A0ABP8Z1N2_9MICO